MDESARTVMHDINLASRKAEEAGGLSVNFFNVGFFLGFGCWFFSRIWLQPGGDIKRLDGSKALLVLWICQGSHRRVSSLLAWETDSCFVMPLTRLVSGLSPRYPFIQTIRQFWLFSFFLSLYAWSSLIDNCKWVYSLIGIREWNICFSRL